VAVLGNTTNRSWNLGQSGEVVWEGKLVKRSVVAEENRREQRRAEE
jgi:hypothetical protein